MIIALSIAVLFLALRDWVKTRNQATFNGNFNHLVETIEQQQQDIERLLKCVNQLYKLDDITRMKLKEMKDSVGFKPDGNPEKK